MAHMASDKYDISGSSYTLVRTV